MEFKRRILWDGKIAPEPVVALKPSYEAPKPEKHPTSKPPAPVKIPVGKNGHRHEFKRDLTGDEKKAIRKWWLLRNGCCGWDDVRDYKTEHLPPEVAIFQVVGYITSLHKALVKGTETITDVAKYNAHRISRGQTPLPAPKEIHPKFTTLARPPKSSSKRRYLAH